MTCYRLPARIRFVEHNFDLTPVYFPSPAADFDAPPPSDLRTFVELSRWQAERGWEGSAFTFLDYEADAEHHLCYGELDTKIRSVAAALAEHGRPGDRVLIVQQPGLEYVASLFGCFYAGMVAVPVYPPDLFRLRQTLPRLQSITSEADAGIMLSSRAILGETPGPLWRVCHGAAIATDEIDASWAEQWRPRTPSPDSLALLQYTSGSTDTPRGVALSHANLVANASQGYDAFHVPRAVACFWLPPYHDMGLVGGMLLPMYGGRPSVLMSPIEFIQRPVRWFEAITRFQGTSAASPNFGYEWCLRKIADEDLEGIDLSSWKVAISGAEPIRAATMRRFAERFGAAGLSSDALTPAYGMAEATLAITGKSRGTLPRVESFHADSLQAIPPVAKRVTRPQADRDVDPDERKGAVTLVGCGRPMRDTDVRIVHPETRQPLPDGHVGEIWVRGPSMASHGYWGKPELSANTFDVDSADGSLRGYLRTGDLGFVDGDDLFVSGRLKEQIILAGRNHFPHDLERAIQTSHEAFRVDGGAAFSVDGDEAERLVVVQEVLRPKRFDSETLVRHIRETLLEHFGLVPDTVVLVTAATLPKTSSGKLRRLECRRQFLDDELQIRHRWDATADRNHAINGAGLAGDGKRSGIANRGDDDARGCPTRETFAAIWCEVLGLERATDDHAFLDVGGHSLAASQLLVRVRERLGVTLEFQDLIRHPTFGELADRVSETTRNAVVDANGTPVSAAARKGGTDHVTLPLTPTQREFWWLEQLGRRDAFTHVGVSLAIEGNLDAKRLATAFALLPERCDALRMRFETDGNGVPIQVRCDGLTWPVRRHDFRDLDALARETEIERVASEMMEKPFNLTKPPLGRAALVRAANDRYRLLLVVHHLVCDGTSIHALIDELASLYAGGDSRSQGDAWADHVVANGNRPSDPESVRHWATRLHGVDLAASRLVLRDADAWGSRDAADHTATSDGGDDGAEVRDAASRCLGDREAVVRAETLRYRFSSSETGRLRAFAADHRVTTFATLLSVWHQVLSRVCGTSDVVMGIPVANRDRSGVESTVGCFLNTVPFRGDTPNVLDAGHVTEASNRCDMAGKSGRDDEPGGSITMIESIRQTQQVGWQDLGHAGLPAEEILANSGIDRSTRCVPWIRHLVLQQPDATAGVRFGDARVTDFAGDYSALGAYDTSLILETHGDALEVTLAHSPVSIDRRFAKNLLESLLSGVRATIAVPDLTAERLPIAGAPERRRITERCRGDRFGEPPSGVIDRFEHQVRERPGAAAVEDISGSVTYSQLDGDATRIARGLIELGVGPGAIVGIRLPRSRHLHATLLGIWKAGAAYLPLDPHAPSDTIASILEDAKPLLVVGSESSEVRSDEGAGGWISVTVEQLLATNTEGREEALPGIDLDRESPAYVIYTSGSTGKPKGVVVDQSNVASLIEAFAESPGFASGERILAATTVTFDISVLELLLPLATGGVSSIAPASVSEDPDAVCDWIAERAFDVIQGTPSSLRMLIARGWSPDGGMRVWCGGEAMNASLADAITSRGARLWNVYGPTETTVWSLVQPVGTGAVDPIPIGRPIAGTSIAVVDSNGRLVPEGVAGELWIGGDGVAQGYLHRDRLTAERFVEADPFADVDIREHRRWYRTGDRVRWRSNGDLEFLGRNDRQIKLRGQRIELGEIEAAICQHGNVAAAAVTWHDVAADDRRVVAFFVPSDGATVDTETLRTFLRSRLARHLIPSHLAVLSELPHTPAGKVDYARLPAAAVVTAGGDLHAGVEAAQSDGHAKGLGGATSAPASSHASHLSDPVERAIAEIWQPFFPGQSVGVEDDFFRRGGHSLMAAQMLSRIRDRFGVSVPLREIYRRPTIAGLADAVREAEREKTQIGDANRPNAKDANAKDANAKDADAKDADASTEKAARDEPSTGSSSPMGTLSFAEQRLWVVDQVEPNHPFYNLPLAARVRGPLDVDLLKESLNDCVARHETLRSRYVIVDGEPQRRVDTEGSVDVSLIEIPVVTDPGDQVTGRIGSPNIEPALPDIDSDLPDIDSDLPGVISDAIRGEARRPFDLSQGPLLRAVVYRLGPEDHVVLLTMHHIVSDGWSMAVLLGELAEFYRARREGQPAMLPPLEVSYSEFAARQRAEMTEARMRPLIEHWKATFRDANEALDMPTDYPRPPVQDFDGATHPVAFSAEQTAMVKRLAEAHGATPFMVLLTAYTTLLSRYTGQRDVSVGTAVANRPETELESLVGFFVGSLVLRMRWDGTPTFAALLDQTREVAVDAMGHSELPFERLVEELSRTRDRSLSPLFQTALVFQNTPRDFRTADGLVMTPVAVDNGTSKYDLSLFLWEDEARFVGHFEYRTGLFRESTIRQLAENFRTLTDAALRDPEGAIDRLPLVSSLAAARIEARGTGPVTGGDDSRDDGRRGRRRQSLHQMALWAAADAPSRVAIVHRDTRTSYADLDGRSRRIAQGLQRLGVGDERRVVLYMDRSADQIASVIGTNRVGAAFVPMECSFPVGRLQEVVADADATVVVVAPENVDEVKLRINDRPVVTPDELAIVDDSRWREPTVAPHRLAYLIYTSGSSGRPKGVAIEHGSIGNFVRGFCDATGMSAEDRVLHQFSPSFDGWLAEVFTAFWRGASLVIADRADVLDPRRLTALIARQEVTFAAFTPPVMTLLDPEQVTSLRTVLSAGAPLTSELARRWNRRYRLFNGYGPTECTVGAAIHRVGPTSSDSSEPMGPPPVGRPLPNTRLYVLDASGQFVPDGVVGEIYIGGDAVGREYWNQPAATATRFVPDPWAKATRITEAGGDNDPAAEPGGDVNEATPRTYRTTPRMYRTGDLGRWNRDGVLEVLGRADDQVKLRGFRIEPAEIAATLDGLPEVAASAVVAWGEDSADQSTARRLVAYVVPSGADRDDADCVAMNGKSESRLGSETQHIDRWRELFDESQQGASVGTRPEDDFAGWTSVITGRPIPVDQMRRWADQAAERILETEPRRVLEIGCGTGLILLRIGEAIENYVGVDVLPSALDQMRRTLDRRPELAAKVSLFRRAAHELDDLKGGPFDTIVLNSVAQYFPSGRYLVEVIREASKRLAVGGTIFLGDLRDLRLHGAFATAAEIARVGDQSITVEQLRRRVQTRVEHEEELLVDPSILGQLKAIMPRLRSADARWKGPRPDGDWDDNELVRFRYDVTLRFDDPSDTTSGDRRWTVGPPERDPRGDIRVEQISWQMLQEARPDQPLSSLLAERDRRCVGGAAEIGRSVAGEKPGVASGDSIDWNEFTNDPLRQSRVTRLVRRLREGLEERVPPYMIPSSFVMVDALPRTPQGKVDHSALPPPPASRPDWAGAARPPRDEHERLLVSIWEELLGVEPVGSDDNFFDLGGHSMLAVRMVSEVESRAGIEIPLAALFRRPTVATLADMLRDPTAIAGASTIVPLNRVAAEYQISGPQPDSAVPLFCVHPAGGTVFCYRELADRLGESRPVFGVQARGIDGRQPPHRALTAMASDYVTAIRDVLNDGPCHLLGWSLGGNIAYEVARQFRHCGGDVGMLVMLDSGRLASSEPASEDDFVSLIAALFPGEEHASLEELRQLSAEEQSEYFVERAAHAGIVPGDATLQGRYLLDVFRANVQAVHDRDADPSPQPIVLLRPADQEKTGGRFDDPGLGWQPLVPSVDVRWVPGDHTHMLQAPAVDQVTELVASLP